MRKIIVVTALLTSSLCHAQDTLFKIISAKGVVMLDNDTAFCGQYVTSSNLSLHIKGKTEYAIILTEKGFVFKLKSGRYSVKELFKKEYPRFANSTGTVYRDDLIPLRIVSTYNSTIFYTEIL